MAVILKNNVRAYLGDFGEFDSVSGGDLERDIADYFAGGDRFPQKLKGGTAKYSDVTLMRGYDPKRDRKLQDWADGAIQGRDDDKNVRLEFMTPQGVVQDSYAYNATFKSIKVPEGKSGDNATAEISITMAVAGRA